MIHYAALGEERTACDLVCRAPTEDGHHTTDTYRTFVNGGWHLHIIDASLDPRRVDCPTCIANMPEAPLCACGAPALYGAGADRSTGLIDKSKPAQWCAECCPVFSRCAACSNPLQDASDGFCQRCLDATDSDDGRDGITEYSDPAGVGGSAAY